MTNTPATDWAPRRHPAGDTRIAPPDTMLRKPEVCSIVGLKKSSIYAKVAAGEFPAPKQLGKRAVAWSANEVFQWLAERPSTR
ncbi:TPA: helix-turn-helix transcriptional regulator [Stenotrophomonas maltophilia]